MNSELKNTDYLKKTLSGAVIVAVRKYNQEVITIDAAKLRDVAKVLRNELGFEMLLDVSALDWKKWKPVQLHRFEIDYFFYSVKNNERVQLKVTVLNDANPEVDSITDLYPSANWAERECWDMMGIKFHGHPNLKRLLMWAEFKGHPLRKDYLLDHRQPIPVAEDLL
jgi:NADH/F420H2 dehydrogenase subunit C